MLLNKKMYMYIIIGVDTDVMNGRRRGQFYIPPGNFLSHIVSHLFKIIIIN